MLKIIFAGTPEFAAKHLEALLKTSHEICAVYTQPDRPAGRGQQLQKSPVKQLAEQHHIPVMQPKSLRDIHEQEKLAEFKCDLMIVAAYGLILPQTVLDTPRLGCMNAHASLLPRWRGAAPIQRAISAGDTETGITFMQMAAGLDTGDMLYKIPCDIQPTETGGSLHDRLTALGADHLAQVLTQLEKKALTPEKQNENLTCYAHKIEKKEAEINWQDTAEHIDRLIRAFNPWPVTFTYHKEKRIRIWQASIINLAHTKKPGTILDILADKVIVATGEKAIAIEKIQLPGSKTLPVADILRGHPQLFHRGDCFA